MLSKFSLHANKMTEFMTINFKKFNMIQVNLKADNNVYIQILHEEECVYTNHVMNLEELIDFSSLVAGTVEELSICIYIIDGSQKVTVDFEANTILKPVILRGDFHAHTNSSGDGRHTISELVEMAEAANLDFITLTDHNSHAANFAKHPETDSIIIPGMELTNKFGHCNLLGKKQAISNCRVVTYEDELAKIREAQSNGATFVANHPFSPKSRSWMVPIMELTPDLVEIWNGPWGMHNRVAFEWWLDILNSGKYIPAIGGSDFHFEDEGKQIYIPTNIITSRFKSTSGILEAALTGNNAISNTDIEVSFDNNKIAIKNVKETVYLYKYERYKCTSIEVTADTVVEIDESKIDGYLVITLCTSTKRDREYIYISNPLIMKG
ncbi:CehA/McbA family metallohydrolase [Mollicutes bacterium LVI A0039]|nr:CehA/McbA family metallohydrolase [Mollicutes bacterium LVI A0039]